MSAFDWRRAMAAAGTILAAATLGGPEVGRAQSAWRFHLEEATIADVHRAIGEGQITCRGLVEAYVRRARAFNGVATRLVTRDGAPVPEAAGVVRAGAPLRFPTTTVAAGQILPQLDEYSGPPLEYGRMEATASDPDVQQQFGMVVGIPGAGQLGALSTLNLRGERSVTCRGDLDRPPSAGPLPDGAPRACTVLRALPDALERATELDARYGRSPDLAGMPMYCIPFTFKDSFDTKDMRTTAGGDARYDADFPARDFTLVEQLRNKGAIIYAKTVSDEYNARAGNPGGRHTPDAVMPPALGYQRSTWGGTAVNPYDTARAAAIGSSSGSAVSVAANLAMCSICEETNASCRGPANHNAQAMILPAKGMLSYFGGAIGNDMHQDRAGILCRTVVDAAKVWDALGDPARGYYDPRDVFTTIRRSTFPSERFVTAVRAGTPGALKGLRIGIIRESMLTFPGVKADEPIVTAAAREITAVLGDRLGATLVESVDPRWTDDPAVENMAPSYTDALAALLPVFYPDILYRLADDGSPEFPDFAAAIRPTAFTPGVTHGRGGLAPADYLVRMADGALPPPRNLNIRSIQRKPQATTFHFHFLQYATRRAADWAALGVSESLVSFADLNARSKFWGGAQRAAFRNWEEFAHVLSPPGSIQATHERAKLRELLQRLDMMVMEENDLDLLVRLHTSLPPGRIGYPGWPAPAGDTRGETAMGPNAGLTEIQVPAGFVRTVFDPLVALDAGRTRYVGVDSRAPTTLPEPGLPFALVFRADPGQERLLLAVASAYEDASRRRMPPPAFGPLSGEP